MGTFGEVAPGPAPRPGPGFWWRLLSPVGAVLVSFVAALLVAGTLAAAGLGDDALNAVIVAGFGVLLLGLGWALLSALPAHERRLAVASKGSRPASIAIGFGIGFAIILGAAIVLVAGSAADPEVERRLEEQTVDLGSSGWQLALTVVSLVVLAPLGEELLFRALLLRALVRRLRFWLAALVSGALFAAAHLDAYEIWPRAIALLGTGVALAFLYRWRGYWAAVTAHLTVNGAAAIAIGVS